MRCAGQERRRFRWYLWRWGTASREHRAGRLETTRSCRVMRRLLVLYASTSAPLGWLGFKGFAGPAGGRWQTGNGQGKEGEPNRGRVSHAGRSGGCGVRVVRPEHSA
nr:unnamed protein product [Digitaria exilis]